MLGIRPCHIVMAVLLHVGILALLWGGKGMAPREAARREDAGVMAGRPLPQRLVVVPRAASSEGDPEGRGQPETTVPVEYAASPQVQTQSAPALRPLGQGEADVASRPEEPAGPASTGETSKYTTYLQEVLAPALGAASLHGLEAPSYAVRGLSDGLVTEMMQGGHGRVVVKARSAFFVLEGTDGRVGFRRIAELPGYARRVLLLRSAFSQAITRAICREYGFSEGDIAVLMVPSAALDRLVLAKQVLAAEQLNTSLKAVRVTEGRLVRRGDAVTFLVDRVVLQEGAAVPIEDGERRFVAEDR